MPVTSSRVVRRSSCPVSGASLTSTVKTTSSSRRRSVSCSAYLSNSSIRDLSGYRGVVLTRHPAGMVPMFNTYALGATLRTTFAISCARRRAVAIFLPRFYICVYIGPLHKWLSCRHKGFNFTSKALTSSLLFTIPVCSPRHLDLWVGEVVERTTNSFR